MDSMAQRTVVEESLDTGESSMKKQTEKNVKSVIAWDREEVPRSVIETLEGIFTNLDCINK